MGIALPPNKKVFWFTGLSGSGKTTLAEALCNHLKTKNISYFSLDGDVLRKGLCRDLGFSLNDRKENLRRAAELSLILLQSYDFILASFITPTNEIRNMIRNIISNDIIEIYIKCSVEKCIERDPKGLYKKALSNDIKFFTGISSVYEPPINPDLIINTQKSNINNSCNQIKEFINQFT
jgi:adenylylsulfate kinase